MAKKTTGNKQDKKQENIDSIIPEEFKRIEELENKLEDSLKNLEKSQEEKKELEEKLLRASADVQNMKRRTFTEVSKARQSGTIKGVSPFVEVVDTFQKAFNHVPEELANHEFIKGIKGVEKNLSEALETLGVEFFGASGDNFDTKLHESMMVDSNTEKGKIAQVFEQGVKMGDAIIRHAKVSVGG